MTRTELDAKLTRLSHFTNPPADVIGDAIEAYSAHVQELEAEIARLNTRVGEEVRFQTFIRKSEQETRNELSRHHQNEKRALIKEIGFAAIIRDRVLSAQWQGRKTIRVEALLEGRPAEDVA